MGQQGQWQAGFIGITLGLLLAPVGLAGNFNHNGDFEGTGCMNPTVYNESTGEWQTLTARNNYNPESLFWGGPGWSAIQSDYDGDGRADIVAYNRTTGKWNVLFSCTSYKVPVYLTFGGAGWVVVTGDYDGDGPTDPTIYCEATGEWRVMLSCLDYATIPFKFGGPGYTAVSGDYDGDGCSDPAIYRRSDGLWLIRFSSLGYTTNSGYVNTMGDTRLVPSPADYDGDRKTDPAVFAYGCGNSYGKEYVFGWYVTYSSLNFRQIAPFRQLGREDCKPSNADPEPGDYDGDGKADYGVSYPDNTDWRMWRSSRNYQGHDDSQWNGIGFRPVQR
jgi:hypothetical protein